MEKFFNDTPLQKLKKEIGDKLLTQTKDESKEDSVWFEGLRYAYCLIEGFEEEDQKRANKAWKDSWNGFQDMNT